MTPRSLLLIPALVAALGAQSVDPYQVPEALQPWARKATFSAQTPRGRLQAILDATFRPVSEGGLGMTYDNSRTRTIEEVWQDRKANCISLTAFFVAACRAVGIEAHYAEPVNTSRYLRQGGLVKVERHLVALVPLKPVDDLVADFLPQVRPRTGVYVVHTLTDSRARALFHSNRAVELLDGGRTDEALGEAERAIQEDGKCSISWNTLGVVQRAKGQTEAAGTSFHRAYALDPRDGAAIGNLEIYFRETGHPEEAARFRTLGLDVRNKDPYFHAFLAEEALGEGHFVEALTRIQAAIKLLPYDPEFHLVQARIRLSQGELDGARKSLEAARRWAQPGERARFDSKLAGLSKL